MTAPTAERRSLIPAMLAMVMGLVAVVLEVVALHGANWYAAAMDGYPAANRRLGELGVPNAVHAMAVIAGVAVVAYLLAAGAALLRKPIGLRVVRVACFLAYALVVGYAWQIVQITGLLISQDIPLLGQVPDSITLFWIRFGLIWKPALGLLPILLVHITTWRAATLVEYGLLAPPAPPAHESRLPGDRLLENLRTHGRDPRYRKSSYSSWALHIFIIFILPWLLNAYGCVEAYRIPKGSGNPVVALVKIVKPKKQKKKQYVLNPKSAISFRIPELEESQVLQQVEQITQQTYQADASRVHGKPGKGGGKKGGWPDGMENAVVRFIRLEYRGALWDDGMGEATGNADANFLREFAKITGFKTRSRGESHPIRDLAKYPKGQAPPFVYMTGEGGIDVSSSDVKILRDYLYDGGMLFADAASMQFDRAFRNWMQVVFPGQPLLVIADDDPIFQQPFVMPNGTPGVQAHGGTKALGIKIKGRWAVYYTPAELNDAWKTGSLGVNPELAQRCVQMGVNIVYYAFTNYLEATRKYRK